MPHTSKILLATVTVWLAACADIPDFSSGDATNAPYPEIVSLQDLRNQVPPDEGDYGIGSLSARAAALKARAARLRQAPIVDNATRARIAAALARR